MWLSKSHECAGNQSCQRMVSDFEKKGLHPNHGLLLLTANGRSTLRFHPLHSSHLPRAPDDGNITGRPWQGCHNSTASFHSCAAGFPLKSVGGREKVSLAPTLSSRPDCQSGSKTSVHRSGACLLHLLASCRHRAGSYAATHAGFVPVIP